MSNIPSVLVVDDERRSLESIQRILSDNFGVHLASDTEEAEAILQREWIQILLCDQRMPGMSGVEFTQKVRELYPDIIRMIISGYTDSQDIIDAVNEGDIYQYITKPWHPNELLSKLKNAIERFELQRQNQQLAVELKLKPDTIEEALLEKRRALKARYDWDQGIIRSPDSGMNKICELIRNVAAFDVNVLLTGETGTGKELCARALHYNSLRQDQMFVAENCGALPDELLESELFGHKRSAFTGANEDRVGLFELASGGTIFLDEIGDTSPAFQIKLLRVLQENEIRPLGSNKRRPINVRVIAATNRNLEEDIRSGKFRQDLFYRLATFEVELPPLRERKEDIVPLAISILKDSMKELGKQVKDISHSWLNAQNEAKHPYHGSTIPDTDENNGYSWCKAPRLKQQVMKVCAVSRQVVDGHPLIRTLVNETGANVRNRVIAKLMELALVVPAMEHWASQIQPKEIFCVASSLPEEAQGAGMVEAARGSLGHWLRIKSGRILNYQIIAPTTWNFSPRDADDKPDALELALQGTEVGTDENASVIIQHIIRSFDPCIVCTVH